MPRRSGNGLPSPGRAAYNRGMEPFERGTDDSGKLLALAIGLLTLVGAGFLVFLHLRGGH